jgi:hypothetical protein
MSAVAIEFRDGRLYLTRDASETYFGRAEAVILLRDGSDLRVLPVRNQGAGGYILKQRNSAGDRVINGADFFRDNGLDDNACWNGRFAWFERGGELRLYDMFPM